VLVLGVSVVCTGVVSAGGPFTLKKITPTRSKVDPDAATGGNVTFEYSGRPTGTITGTIEPGPACRHDGVYLRDGNGDQTNTKAWTFTCE